MRGTFSCFSLIIDLVQLYLTHAFPNGTSSFLVVSTAFGPSRLDQPLRRWESCGRVAQKHYTKIDLANSLIKYVKYKNAPGYNPKNIFKCPFRVPTADVSLQMEKDFTVSRSDAWTCIIPASFQCDGVSSCLTDECSCSTNSTSRDAFYCIEQPGCIPFHQLCDSKADCLDTSDECLCQGFVNVVCANETVSCENPLNFCTTKLFMQHSCHTVPQVNCSDVLRENNATNVYDSASNPVYRCLIDRYSDAPFDPHELQNFCERECLVYFGEADWQRYCKYIIPAFPIIDYSFQCNGFNFVDNYDYLPSLNIICDGISDCKNNIDEIGCPGRFYCAPEESSTVWVEDKFKCDNVKHCPNGRDECQGCDLGVFTSSQSLLKSLSLALGCLTFGILIVFLNARNCYTVLMESFKRENISKSKMTDAILCFTISIYDLMMGLYLCLIALSNFVLRFKGDFCQISFQWRSSLQCDLLGILFSFSSHGSLLIVSLMSVIRGIKCTFVFIDIPFRAVASLCIFISLLNLIHSVMPALRFQFLQNVFISQIHLDNILENPLLKTYEEAHLRVVYQAYNPSDNSASIMEMLDKLRTITSNPKIFDYTQIGYYGTTPLCIHNIFKNQESYQTYKISFCTSISILLCVVIVSYILIIIQQVKSPKAETKTLITKVSLIIGSQLVCWVSLITITIFFMRSDAVPNYIFEIFALFAIPLNSFLNPIFYSDFNKVVIRWVAKAKSSLSLFAGPPSVENIAETLEAAVDTEMTKTRRGSVQDTMM